MKKFLLINILTYLLLTLNINANSQDTNKITKNDNKILKIGVLVPLSGEFEKIGNSVLRAIQLAITKLNNPNIIMYPKDNKGNPGDTYKMAKEFESLGINIVIGPIFFENLEKLNQLSNITFISLTNKTQNLPKNIISFGINVNSQFESISDYLLKNEFKKTILLLPESEFGDQIKPIVDNQKFKFYKTHYYNTNPKKLTAEIQKITDYNQRKINLKARIKKLEKSELQKDINELKQLEQFYTLGKVDFNSVVIADFGEILKSALTSFTFSDVSNEEIKFITLNQWFDESLFNEQSFQNLIFPGIDKVNFDKFRKEYFDVFNQPAVEISVLAYDALGLIYTIWIKNNNSKFNTNEFSSKTGFKGTLGKFVIKNNITSQKLKIYKVNEKKFIEIF